MLVGDATVLSSDVAARCQPLRAVRAAAWARQRAASTSQALNRFAFTVGHERVGGHRPAAPGRPSLGAAAAGAHRSPVIVLDGRPADLPSANAALLRDLGVTS